VSSPVAHKKWRSSFLIARDGIREMKSTMMPLFDAKSKSPFEAKKNEEKWKKVKENLFYVGVQYGKDDDRNGFLCFKGEHWRIVSGYKMSDEYLFVVKFSSVKLTMKDILLTGENIEENEEGGMKMNEGNDEENEEIDVCNENEMCDLKEIKTQNESLQLNQKHQKVRVMSLKNMSCGDFLSRPIFTTKLKTSPTFSGSEAILINEEAVSTYSTWKIFNCMYEDPQPIGGENVTVESAGQRGR
jgi:hypothetical protein